MPKFYVSDDRTKDVLTVRMLLAHNEICRMGAEALRIMQHHLPEWIKLFLNKNGEYQTGDTGDNEDMDAGLPGQYSDMYRKLKKLRRPMLLGDDSGLITEQPEEILFDLIGHCFLSLDMLRTGRGRVWDDGKHS
jgi:hypothetical protein